MSTEDGQYVLVQHSGWGYGGQPEFARAVESRYLPDEERGAAEALGVTIFQGYAEGSAAEEEENWPEGYEGIIPRVRGWFTSEKMNGLAYYRQSVGVTIYTDSAWAEALPEVDA